MTPPLFTSLLFIIRPADGDVVDEEENVHDEPDSDGEAAAREIMFTFESFELVSWYMVVHLYSLLT